MNPLEDAIVALRPMDPTKPLGSTMQFTGVDPSGSPVTVTNQVINFGWEYVWHCHLLCSVTRRTT
jgi:hypothetical protein